MRVAVVVIVELLLSSAYSALARIPATTEACSREISAGDGCADLTVSRLACGLRF